MSDSFRYPSIQTILPTTHDRFAHKTKFVWRQWAARSQVQTLEAEVNQRPFAQRFFAQCQAAPYGLIHLYVNRHFDRKQRLEAMLGDLDAFDRHFSHALDDRFQVEIARIDETLTLVLGANPIDQKEEFWAFTLYNEQRDILYNVSFSFVADHGLVITSIQGPSSDDAKDIMREMTKRMHGLRPQQFAIWLMQSLAYTTGRTALFGTAQSQQIKVRFALKKRLPVNYDEIWPLYDGERDASGYWSLPLVSEQKKIEDVASKKRAMYRRRYAMQEAIVQGVYAAQERKEQKKKEEQTAS